MIDVSVNMINCTAVEEHVICNGTLYILPEKRLTYLDQWFWIYLGIYVALVLLAGLVSGLTMGLLSLDMMTLKILNDGGSPKEKKYATKILPIVKRHHLLLVTLLLANAAAVEAMPIFLDRISDPVTAIVVSVSAVLLFGEVFPQALCTRFGLAIGATLAPFVYFLMGLLFVISWPLSKLLDCLLGKEHDTFFRRAQLKVLVDLHGPLIEAPQSNSSVQSNDHHLTMDEVMIIKGALDMKDKVVQDAMLPLNDVFMLSLDAKLDRPTMTKILSTAHSRVPVYTESRQNILGLLLVKMLIHLDPDDGTPVELLLNEPSCFRKVPTVYNDMALFDLLNLFQTGKSHLCIVKKHPDEGSSTVNSNQELDQVAEEQQEIIGIITLEDVIEELIQEEIVDETDVFVDIQKRIKVARAKMARQVSSRSNQDQIAVQVHVEGKSATDTLEVPDDPLVDLSTDPETPLLSREQS